MLKSFLKSCGSLLDKSLCFIFHTALPGIGCAAAPILAQAGDHVFDVVGGMFGDKTRSRVFADALLPGKQRPAASVAPEVNYAPVFEKAKSAEAKDAKSTFTQESKPAGEAKAPAESAESSYVDSLVGRSGSKASQTAQKSTGQGLSQSL